MEVQITSRSREGRPPGSSNWMAELHGLFPLERFRADVGVRGPIETLAQKAGISVAQVYAWRGGREVPRYSRLEAFLSANNIPRDGYTDYLRAANPTINAICTVRASKKCWRDWSTTRGKLALLNQKRKERGASALIPGSDGVLSTRCAACASVQVGQRGLKETNKERFEGFENVDRREVLIEVMGGEVVVARLQEKFRRMALMPKSENHKTAIAEGRVAAGLTKPFRFCHLCHLALYEQHPGADCERPHWHRPCLEAFRSWFKREHGRLPQSIDFPRDPRAGRRGPKPEALMLRDYAFLMAEARGDRAAIKHLCRRADRRKKLKARDTLTKAGDRFFERCAGDWDLIISKTMVYRAGNAYRRELLPLPRRIWDVIAPDSRDTLVRRLGAFNMPIPQIARISGVSTERIEAILFATTSDQYEEARDAVLKTSHPPDGHRSRRLRSPGRRTPINQKLSREQLRSIMTAPDERGVIERLAREHDVSREWISTLRRGQRPHLTKQFYSQQQ